VSLCEQILDIIENEYLDYIRSRVDDIWIKVRGV
jgi:hypothetical protein